MTLDIISCTIPVSWMSLLFALRQGFCLALPGLELVALPPPACWNLQALSPCVARIEHFSTVTIISRCLLFQIQKKRGDLRLIVASATLDAEVRASLSCLNTGVVRYSLGTAPLAKACLQQDDLPLWGPCGAPDVTWCSFSTVGRRQPVYPRALMITSLPCLCLCCPPPDTGSFFLVTGQCEAILIEFIYENYILILIFWCSGSFSSST